MKKSVLFIVQNLPVPQDRRVWTEAKTLKENGYDISVISPRNHGQSKYEIVGGIKIYRYKKAPNPSGFLGYLWEYAYSFVMSSYLTLKVYLKSKFSIIHIANPPDFLFFIALPFKLFGVKLIYDQHDLMPEMLLCKFKKNNNSLFYNLLIWLERWSYQVSNLHISTCQSGYDVMASRIPLFKSQKSFIVRSAPDKKVISPALVNKDKSEKLRSRFRFIVSYLGVMGPQDGVDKLIRSIGVVINDFGRNDIGFILMGNGDHFENLNRLARGLGVSRNVIFTGWADGEDISTNLFSSDIGVMPEPKNSYTDNSLHNKVLEYMLAGLPVISYDLKEAKKSAREAAIFVSDNDERKFAQAIIGLLDDEEKRKTMSQTGKNRAEKLFHPDISRLELIRAYDSIKKNALTK